MKNVRVAVFPAGSEIGLEICSALQYDKYVELIGLTSVRDHAEMVYRETETVPYYQEEDFIEKLNEVLERAQVDYLYPAYDDVLLFLTRRQREIHAKIITTEPETIEITRFKRKTYEFLKCEPFVPKVYSSREKVERYPVFVKPDRGQGAQGTQKIEKEADWGKVEDLESMVITEYLPGEEVTVDCFTDGNGVLCAYEPRRRIRIKSGIAVRSEVMDEDFAITDIANVLNGRLQFKGAWFFQLKKNQEGEYRLLEIAARVAGTMGLGRSMGINYPLLTLYVHMGLETEVIPNSYHACVDRALVSRYELSLDYRTVYVDLDDTLILKGQVNDLLIRYLYQCVNKGKRLVLLSRHAGDMGDYLRRFRISEELFDQIVFVGDSPKSEYVQDKRAILIDDSFRERKEVMRNCGFPVFGTENVESLIDWKR
ncbi:MAG: ATP-grasp domain-containing protein [Lachnospiraceae bacterium]|nr:ATP-grasp domain-containing protein [Lachnospiraceae bacterium]